MVRAGNLGFFFFVIFIGTWINKIKEKRESFQERLCNQQKEVFLLLFSIIVGFDEKDLEVKFIKIKFNNNKKICFQVYFFFVFRFLVGVNQYYIM